MTRWARLGWAPAIALAVGGFAVFAALRGGPSPAPLAAQGEPPLVRSALAIAAEAAPPSPGAAMDVAAPAPPIGDTELPEKGRVYVPGQGWATVVPSDPAHAPEPEAEHPLPAENPAIPPERPRTAEWRGERARIAQAALERRLAAAGEELRAASASGDAARIRRAEAALERQRSLLEAVRGQGTPSLSQAGTP